MKKDEDDTRDGMFLQISVKDHGAEGKREINIRYHDNDCDS